MLRIRIRRLSRLLTLLGLLLAASAGCEGTQPDLDGAVVVPEPGTSSSIDEASGNPGLEAID